MRWAQARAVTLMAVLNAEHAHPRDAGGHYGGITALERGDGRCIAVMEVTEAKMRFPCMVTSLA